MLNRLKLLLEFFVVAVCVTAVLSQSPARTGQVTDQLDNGCTITRKMGNSTNSKRQNKLTEVPSEALKSFPNLKTLVINNNQITEIKNDEFKYNSKLSIISLGVNPITNFGYAWMKRLNLTGLNIRNCGLSKVPSPIANMSSLLYVDLSENTISNLPANSFINASSLYWLDLAANKITNVNENAFKGATRLTVVDLSDNLLQNVAANTFNGLTKENIQVDLYENPLLCDCSMAPFRRWSDEMKVRDASTEIRYSCENPLRNHGKKSHQLTIADFTCDSDDVMWSADCASPMTATISPPPASSEPVRTCPSKCTCYNSKKEVYYPPPEQKPNKKYTRPMYWRYTAYPRVDCVDTGYTSIPQDIPDDVQTIAMYGNRLTTFKLKELNKFRRLKTLFLKGNNIRTILGDARTILPSMNNLRLSYNNISIINKTHLQSFPNLQVFSIYHNNLTTIPNDLFAFNSLIRSLYLGPNPVKNFKEDFMKTLDITRLSLRNMSLTEVPASLSNLDKLIYLDISDNKITSLKNSTFAQCSSLLRVALDNNRISKIEPNAFNGATSLLSLDLSENNITWIHSDAFSTLSQERLTVELWGNPILCDCNMKEFKAWIEERESNDPLTEVRFICDQPRRMHGKKSDQLSSSQFFCASGDANYVEIIAADCQKPNYGGKIALSVILTFICTALLGFVLWRCTFRRRYGHLLNYAKQRENYDDDMEELQ